MNFLDKHFGRVGNRMFQSFYLYAQMREGKIPDVYLQDCKYFDKYRDELQALLPLEKNDKISVHIRLGKNPSNPDEPAYAENPFYVNLTKTDYYRKAMKQFNGRFVVFSDNLPWCEKQEIFKDCEFAGFNEEDDFKFMAACSGHIIANSSFSYMAAYLGGGRTIYPKEWFADGKQRIGFPSDWIGI